jgi:hypothetical protein
MTDCMILFSVTGIALVFVVVGYIMGRNSAGQPAVSHNLLPPKKDKPSDDDGLTVYDRALMGKDEDVSTL